MPIEFHLYVRTGGSVDWGKGLRWSGDSDKREMGNKKGDPQPVPGQDDFRQARLFGDRPRQGGLCRWRTFCYFRPNGHVDSVSSRVRESIGRISGWRPANGSLCDING